MADHEYVSMDQSRKIYIPSALEKEFKGKKFIILPMPDGDVVFHPVAEFKGADALARFQRAGGKIRRDLKEVKKDILQTAMEGL